MKKLLALLLAALLLATAACAETASTTLRFSDVALISIDGSNVETTRVPDLSIEGAIGMSGLRPSVELTFIYGDAEQELGAVAQLVGTQLLGSVGSISTVFALDLEKVTGDPGSAGLAAMAVSSAISLGGVSLAGMINAFTQEAADGAREAHVEIPTERFAAAFDRALEKAEGLEAADRVDFTAIREKLDGLGETVTLDIRFVPATGELTVGLSQDARALQLSAVLQLANAPFTYADIDLEAERVDVTDLTDADIALLNDEVSLIAGRMINMAAAMGLSKYFPEK